MRAIGLRRFRRIRKDLKDKLASAENVLAKIEKMVIEKKKAQEGGGSRTFVLGDILDIFAERKTGGRHGDRSAKAETELAETRSALDKAVKELDQAVSILLKALVAISFATVALESGAKDEHSLAELRALVENIKDEIGQSQCIIEWLQKQP